MKKRRLFVSLIALFSVATSAVADMTTIIARLSQNSDKIDSYSANARIRYHI